jgi:hypothetical protein
MRARIVVLAALFLATSVVAKVPDATPIGDKQAFFDGKSLEGWEGLTEYWSVKDGAIVGATPDGLKFNTFLCSKRKYKDFELKFEVRLKDGKGNTGCQIRSTLKDTKQFVVWGPQCDMGTGYWGDLFGEHHGPDAAHFMIKQAPKDIVEKAVKNQGDFIDYAIKCVGKHVTIKLNGLTTVDGDFDTVPAEGVIAFQLHSGGPMEVTFRNIQFAVLTK